MMNEKKSPTQKDVDEQNNNSINNYSIPYNEVIINERTKSLRDTIEKESRKLKSVLNRKLTSSDILEVVLNNVDICVERFEYDGRDVYAAYVFNPSENIYESDEMFFKNLLLHACYGGSVQNNKLFIENAMYELSILLSNPIIYPWYKPIKLPPKHVILFNNGILNRKNNKFYEFNEDNPYRDFNFIQKVDNDFISEENLNPLSSEIVDTIMSDWSGGDKERLKFLYQFASSAIEGVGKNKCVLFNSPGGTGKSSYMELIELSVGKQYTLRMNLHDLKNDNTVNKLKRSTKFILGDDLVTNFTFSGTTLSRFKTAVTGGTFMVSKKYMDDMPVRVTGAWSQSTNTPIKSGESDQAVYDRLIVYNWPHYNYRANNPHNFNLKMILEGDLDPKLTKSVVESFISKAFTYSDYSSSYELPQSSLDLSQKMLDDGDKIVQFIHYLDEQGILHHIRLPKNLLYQLYTDWHIQYHKGSTVISLNLFNRRIKDKLIEFGFESKNDPKKLKYLDERYLIPSDYGRTYTKMDLEQKTSYYENENNMPNGDEIKLFDEDGITIDELKTNNRLRFVAYNLFYTNPKYRDLPIDEL